VGLDISKDEAETVRAALRDVGDAGWLFPGLRPLVAACPGLFSGCPSGAGSARDVTRLLMRYVQSQVRKHGPRAPAVAHQENVGRLGMRPAHRDEAAMNGAQGIFEALYFASRGWFA
jgi:hypothetical protein